MKQLTQQHRLKIARAHRGKTLTLEHREAIRRSLYNFFWGADGEQNRLNFGKKHEGRIWSRISRKKISTAMRGENNPAKRKEVREKMSFYAKHRSPEYVRKLILALKKKPNGLEKKTAKYLEERFPNQFRYSGAGSFFINGRIPDFIDIEGRRVVEVNGIYWHLLKRGFAFNKKNKRRIEHIEAAPYKKAGYTVIFIWEDTLIPSKFLKKGAKLNEN